MGPRIRLARESAIPSLTQEALAARLQLDGWNISRVSLAKIEAGIRQVTDIEVSKLARALGVSVAWLFDEPEG